MDTIVPVADEPPLPPPSNSPSPLPIDDADLFEDLFEIPPAAAPPPAAAVEAPGEHAAEAVAEEPDPVEAIPAPAEPAMPAPATLDLPGAIVQLDLPGDRLKRGGKKMCGRTELQALRDAASCDYEVCIC